MRVDSVVVSDKGLKLAAGTYVRAGRQAQVRPGDAGAELACGPAGRVQRRPPSRRRALSTWGVRRILARGSAATHAAQSRHDPLRTPGDRSAAAAAARLDRGGGAHHRAEDAGLVDHRFGRPAVGRDGVAGQPGQRDVRAGDGDDRPAAGRRRPPLRPPQGRVFLLRFRGPADHRRGAGHRLGRGAAHPASRSRWTSWAGAWRCRCSVRPSTARWPGRCCSPAASTARSRWRPTPAT